ncbi:unnamed protein product [Rotaria socialis]|uniref:Uncharacterized protein n=1 Tax=Rotaria socialis TaxID=392032 RepID=A0A820RQN8_9BILA|nr:unnamed protein product [Rotaria socialis]CAF3499653.1 unnamed protein product [Rotaria socialis]CAF4265894.1 unnamed protein product [Rotaria socialis]CAF4439857.1 unnamed protein product [Rotaria socialis]CAF4500516.1 unnamed protein product [Rotaria socialis]
MLKKDVKCLFEFMKFRRDVQNEQISDFDEKIGTYSIERAKNYKVAFENFGISSLILRSSDNEPGVDLLKITGTKGKANLYVTTLIQLMYTMEELAALQPADTYSDNGYKLIQEAVRSKFKLSDDHL